MGSELKVGDIMHKDVKVVNENATIVEVSKLMRDNNVGSVVVLNEKKAIGIVTERDVVHKVNANDRISSEVKILEIMSNPIIAITPEKSLEDAAKAMKMHNIKRLPVINEEKELIGIITEGDIVEVFPAVLDLVEEKAMLNEGR